MHRPTVALLDRKAQTNETQHNSCLLHRWVNQLQNVCTIILDSEEKQRHLLGTLSGLVSKISGPTPTSMRAALEEGEVAVSKL